MEVTFLNFTPEKVTTKPHQILEVTRKNLIEFDPSIEQKSLMPGSWRQVTQWNFLSCNKRRCRTSPREMTMHFLLALSRGLFGSTYTPEV